MTSNLGSNGTDHRNRRPKLPVAVTASWPVRSCFGALMLLAAFPLAATVAPSSGKATSSNEVDAALVDQHRTFVRRTCVRCHRDRTMTGGLTLESFDVGQPAAEAEIAEKMVRKLRTGMMPPPPMRRPDPDQVAQLVSYLEHSLDEAAEQRPIAGRRTFQRLNRAEYQRSIAELLGIAVDVEALLPADTISQGFDNIADVQTLSPTLMESYLRAADKISRAAVGDAQSSPGEATYRVPRTASQRDHVEGAPWGTRGGLAVDHTFPADGEYSFRALLHSTPTGQLFGATADNEQLEISIDGRRVALLDIDPMMDESDPGGMEQKSDTVFVRSGTRRVAAAFIDRFDGPVNDLLAPIDHTLADTQIGTANGVTTVPHLRSLAITGPFRAGGLSASTSRQRIFTCRPTSAAEEMPCAREILESLGQRAYRRTLERDDLGALLSFYEAGATEGGFEEGVRIALQAMLTSPHFVFRLERVPDEVLADVAADLETQATGVEEAGDAVPSTVPVEYDLDDRDLASRLSFFLWGTVPDETLLRVAEQGRLEGAELERQVDRMLADPRSEALATRFGAQWFRLQDLENLHPDALAYPMYDHRLAEAMREETLHFFEHIVREDRSVLDVLSADYTFVNERLARHYGIDGVEGPDFRKVALDDPRRFGILGHGSILASTSHANRTSPVLRGKWVMEVLLGSPPPPPPPDVPELEEADSGDEGRLLTVRERLEEHRANPACSSCHNMIDPIGLALENFDVTGAWRSFDEGSPINPEGTLYDGTELSGPGDLREALEQRADVVVTTFTESLLSYAIGRRVDYRDMPMVRDIVRGAEEGGHRFSTFIHGIVASPAFSRRVVGGQTVGEGDRSETAAAEGASADVAAGAVRE